MSKTAKDRDIANIVRELDKLTLQQTKHILDYIQSSSKSEENSNIGKGRTAATQKYYDRDGAVLVEGDRVYLLTGGVDNEKGEEATVRLLPKDSSLYISLIPERYDTAQFKNTIKKMPKNVRKVLYK